MVPGESLQNFNPKSYRVTAMVTLINKMLGSAQKALSTRPISGSKQNPWLGVLAALFMCALVFIIYSNTLTVPFVFDDRTSISDNTAIRITSLTVDNLKNAAFKSPIPSRPLANISLALNYYFHKYTLPGYHLVNIAIHILNGIVLYFLFVITLRTPALQATVKRPQVMAFAAAAIWVVHPLQTQSVTYIIQRMNSAATMFYLLAMLLYVTARLSPVKRMKIILFTGCALSGLAGFWFKEILVTLPFFILLYEYYFLQNMDISWSRNRFFIATAIVLSFAGIIVVASQLDSMTAGYGSRQFTLSQRLLTEPRVVIFYISQLFAPLPSRLNLFHDFSLSSTILQPLTTLFSIMSLTTLLGLAGWLARRQRLVSFCILWYLGNLALESSVIPLEIIFEHRNYLPSTFFCLMFSYLIIRSLSFVRIKALTPIILCLLVITLSSMTYVRNNAWQDEETLLIDCLAKSPYLARVQASLGYVLMWQWRLNEAKRRFLVAMQLNPTPTDRYRIKENVAFINKMKNSPDYHK